MPDRMDDRVPGGGRRNYRSAWNDPNSAKYGGGAPRPTRPGWGAPNPVSDGRGFGMGQTFKQMPGVTLSPSQGRSWSSDTERLGTINPSDMRTVPMQGYSGGIAGTYGGGPLPPQAQPFPSTPPPGFMGSQQSAYANPYMQGQVQTGFGGGNPYAMDMERRRRMLMLQQQMGGGVQQMFQPGPQIQNQQVPMGGIGQVSARVAEPWAPQNITQPFPTQSAWQQKVPQTFNQASAYGPYTRSW